MKQYSMPYNVFKTITSNFFICVSIIICVVFLSENAISQTYDISNNQNTTVNITPASICGDNYTFSVTFNDKYTKTFSIKENGVFIEDAWNISGAGISYFGWSSGAVGNNNGNSALNNATIYGLINPVSKSIVFSTTPPLCGTPAVALAANTVPAANIGQGTTNNVVHGFTLTTTTADATLNTVSFSNTGNAVYSTDVTNYKLYYTATSGTFSTGTLLKTITTGTSFTGLTQSLPVGGPYYFWITADVANAATAGRTIIIGAMEDTDFAIASGDKSGGAAASGTQTITAPSVTISSGATVAAANVGQNAKNHVVSTIAMSVADAATTVNSVAFSNTGTANYTNDITNYKLYYTATSNTFATSTLLGTITSGTSFTGLTQSLPVGGPYYFWITADVTSTATVDNTITISQINSENITFASGSKSGNNAAAGTQTIMTAVPKNYYYTGSNGGDWNTASNWKDGCSGTLMTTPPTIYDHVFINCNNDRVVKLSASSACASLTIGQQNSGVDLNGHSLTIAGNVDFGTGNSNRFTNTAGTSNTLHIGGNVVINSQQGYMDISTYTVTIDGDVTLASQLSKIQPTTGSISIGGNLLISGYQAHITTTSGNVSVAGNVTFTGGQAKIVNASGNVSVAGTYTNTSGNESRIEWGTGTTTITGDMFVKKANGQEPLKCTSTGWFEMDGGLSQTITVSSENITIPRFRQSNTGFTKAGDRTLTISNTFDRNCGPLKPADVTVSIPANTINTECNNPTLNVSQASLSGFLYCHGSGPSAYQTIKVSGENLTNNVVVTAPENYEISTTSDFADVSPITLTVVDGEVQNQPETLYVRLKSGLDAGNYNENITLTSTDANTVQVSCSGAVSNTPIITLNTATLSGFSYYVPDGPSASQYYTVAGSCLTENIVATPLANYEVSLNNTAFSSSVTLTPTNGMVQATKVYVRLKVGLAAANYNETITHTSSGAVQKDIACSGSVITPAMLAFSSLSQIGVGDIHKQDKDRILSTFQVEVTVASAELLSIPFTTSGTHTANDIKSYALWVNDANTGFAYAKRCGGKIFTTTGAGTHIFDNIEYTFAPGTTYYMWITADVATDAVTGNTVQVDAIDVAHISLTNGAKSGTISAAGLQTIVPTAQLTEFMYIVTQGPSKYQTFSIASSSLSGDGSITVTVPNSFYEISKSPSGDYTNTLTYNYTNGVLAPAAGIVYVRLKQGLSVGEYTETITINGGGYTNTVNCSGGVGQVYYAKNNNLNWNDASSWSLSCGGSDAGSIPTYKDSAVIGCYSGSDNWFEDNTFSLGGNVVVGGIKIDRKATLALEDFNLRVKNDVQIGITNTWADGQGAINVGNGTLIVENNLTLGYNNDKHGLKWDAGNIYIGGNLICADDGGPLPLKPGTDEHQNRSLRPGGGTESDESFVVNIPSYTGAIIMTGEQKSIQVSALAVDLVRVKLESNTISKTGAGILYITEEFNFNGVTSFTNSEGTTVITGDILYANSATLENKAKLEIGTLKNNINMHNAAVGSHTEYFLSGAEPVNHGSYYDLTISGGGVKTLMGDIEVQNKLHFPVSGYLDLNGHNLTMKNWQNGNIYPITSADRYVISNNGTFTIEGVDNGETANFPIGLSPADEDYCRVDITNNSGTHTFTIDGVCNALYSNGTCDGAGGGVKATHQAVGLTWFISSLSNNADITLYWHPSKHLPAFNEDNAILSHYGSQWSKPEDAISIQSFAGNFKTITGNATSFSPFSVQNSEGLLPIELLWFRAKKRAEGTLLEWETATEINNDYFTLHRSYNGVFFNPLSTISGAGNSSYNTKYSYIDTEKLYGTTYYQLSQTDYDGAVSYSHVVSTYTELPTFELLSYKQQGGVSQFELLFAEYESDNHCKIVSTLGAVLHEQVFTNSAYELIEIALKPGVYTLLNTVEGHTYSIKVVVR